MPEDIFRTCCIYILPNGLLKKRVKLFEEQIVKSGGKVVSDRSNIRPTHVVVEDKLLMNTHLLKNALKSNALFLGHIRCDIVGTLWLSRCLKEKTLLDTDNFRLKSKRKADEDETTDKNKLRAKLPKIEIPTTASVSSHMYSRSAEEKHSRNEIIINEFQRLAEAYRARGDRWRTLAYDKAIVSLKCFQKPITSINDVKLLPNISVKMIAIISEILEDGSCRKAEIVCNDEKTQVLNLFSKVWGAASTTAQSWYQMGCRTLEDLQTKINLTHQQKIGLKYFNDIQAAVPRQEVEQIIDVVKAAVTDIESSVRVVPCGSFRRGQQTCGDIDVLLIVPSDTNYRTILSKIVFKLKCDDFLIDDLVGGKEEGAYSKYLGLCRLPGKDGKIRRLDLFIVPEHESACAIMHFTGSALFNRGIRSYALKMKMKLSENALVASVSDGKYAAGYVFPTPTEEAIFEHLKLQYRPPQDRAFF